MNGNVSLPGSPVKSLSIGEVARRAGVSVDTVRHYERRGLIGVAERTASGYRRFPPGAVERVMEVRAAVALGFGLDELARAISEREHGRPPCRSVRDLLAEKGEELDRRIEELLERRRRVAETVALWDRRLAATPEGRPAHLLRELGHTASAPTIENSRRKRARDDSKPRRKGRR